eukprot:COSAG01_NODE_69540_length_261_cov_0.635802_1_plen_59_part_01
MYEYVLQLYTIVWSYGPQASTLSIPYMHACTPPRRRASPAAPRAIHRAARSRGLPASQV